MTATRSHTALLFFSRTPAAEAAAKPLAQHEQSAKALAQFLVKKTHQLAKQTDLKVILLTEKEQHGATFGERFANAFDDLFEQGFDNVIAIGNDCLTLTTQEILTAEKALKTTPSVLGATADGGAYLIGLNKVVFQKNAFQNIGWQTPTLFSDLVELIENQYFTSYFLPKKTDIDQAKDWLNILPKLNTSLQKFITQLLDFGEAKIVFSAFLLPKKAFVPLLKMGRAPPVFGYY